MNARAESYSRQTNRIAFSVCRYALRTLLSPFLNTPPDAIRFEYSRFGKPSVADSPIQFNVTHSSEWGAVIVASQQVGIDLEKVRDLSDRDGLVQQVFSLREQALLLNLA